MATNNSFSRLSDNELLIEVKRLTVVERETTADVIRALMEVKARKLHLAIGCGSMFDYCTRVLRFSEHAAYARIAAAGWAADYPLILDLLVEGAITLTSVTLLGRHLTTENHVAVLEAARHKSKAEVEMLVATLNPQPDVRSSVRKLPEPKCAEPPTVETMPMLAAPTAMATDAAAGEALRRMAPTPPVVRPIAPERYRLQVTQSARKRERNCSAPRICCGTRRPGPTKPPSSIAL